MTAYSDGTQVKPENKHHRYDRQLRLWAATGQDALESARVLVLSASATSCAVLKNLVLPGIGDFTILDDIVTTAADAANNFFLHYQSSVGNPRASEAVECLCELNDNVRGFADTRTLGEVIDNREWLAAFTVIIAHNLNGPILEKLSSVLWEDWSYPPLIVVRSVGFFAEFFIQFHEHTIIESHSETPPSLRIDSPFPLLKEQASIDFLNMNPSEHCHIPYVIILVRVLEDWKASHDGKSPRTAAEKEEFKRNIRALKIKSDEENFDDAEAQAYRCWTETGVPQDIATLFNDPAISPGALGPTSPLFFHLLAALKEFTEKSESHTLPLTSTLPDMKSDTNSYIQLQKLYKTQSEEEKKVFKSFVKVPVEDAVVDVFVKNAHALQVLRGKPWYAFDKDRTRLLDALANSPKAACIHLSLSALSALKDNTPVTEAALCAQIESLIGSEIKLPECLGDAVTEVVRAPTAELPTTAAFLGGIVAHEAIKMITKQYIPVTGHCVIDLIETSTAVIGV